jgi:hypothetical protein
MEWSHWNWINVFFVFFSGWVAAGCFDNNNNGAGWLNLFASALNGAIIAGKFL